MCLYLWIHGLISRVTCSNEEGLTVSTAGRKVLLLQLVVIKDKYLFIYSFMLFYYVYVPWRMKQNLELFMDDVPIFICRMDGS